MAESPAQLYAEIEKYERKQAENPEGRYFVPLANAYRKLGDYDRAERLLREGLTRHPDYLSAHIVLGRTLADRGSVDEAADEFRHVLGIDPQNLIALRTLGELAVAAGRLEEARHWYGELLVVDPMNDEARQALAELSAQLAAAEATPSTAPPTADAVDQSESGVDGAGPAEYPPAELGWADDAGPDTANTAAVPGELAAEEATAAAAAGAEEDTVDFFDWSPPAEERAADAGAEAEPEPADAGLAEHEVAGWAAELSAPEDVEAAPAWEAEELEPTGSEAAPEGELATETIAELYASQGFHREAADVYRVLIQRRGEEPALVQRLEELETQLADPPRSPGEAEPGGAEPRAAGFDSAAAGAREVDAFADSFAFGFAGAPAEGDAAPAAEEEAPAAAAEDEREADAWMASKSSAVPAADEPPLDEPERNADAPAEEPTIGQYLAGLLGWRPAAGAELAAPAPAADAVASTAPVSEADAAADADAEADAEPAAPVGSGPAAVDDDLFPWELSPTAGHEPGHEPPASPAAEQQRLPPEAAPAASSAAPSPEPPPAADEEEDDLESFQAWLRSLKR